MQLEDVLRTAKGRVTIGIKGGNRVPLNNQVVFVVRSQVAGRLIVIDVNSEGQVVQILPNRYTPAHTVSRISADTDVVIPGPGYGFTAFKAIEPVGRSQLLAIVVSDNFPSDALINTRTHGQGIDAGKHSHELPYEPSPSNRGDAGRSRW